MTTALAHAGTAAIADAAAELPQHDRTISSTRINVRVRRGIPVMVVIAALIAAVLPLLGATPAQAASYRDLKSVRYGTCFYNYGDPLEDLYLKRCNTTPAKYGNWAVTNAGYYNNHPLWIVKRQGGSCLGVLGNASHNYLYMSCSPTNSSNVWEVFTTSSGRRVLKSFGAYQRWGQHKCLTFNGPYGGGKPQLGSCSLTSTAAQIYK